ncbi:hypothetical protein C8Q75DRAFT_710209 [Abortiporus biennis]|nr:hypothetical protein C8Q75DRAFT_710209 [Abortiporus biennis]
MHFPFTPNHVQLIAACYPPNAALLNSGPEYRPNAQELSRMTYYASNRPGKINKLSGELERRVRIDCRKAQAGNLRARASLLITLAMFKALATECRRDISLLSSSLLASINVTLSGLSSDLEVAARAASVFAAWTAYTDGHLIGVDRYVTEEHMACLQVFSRMGQISSTTLDHEIRNRTRLLGLSAILGVVTSEVLYYSSTQFKPQISTIVPALIIPLLNVDVANLEEEIAEIKEQPTAQYIDGIATRPTIERRAASIHLHVDGDKGPSTGDVANTSIRALSTLFSHANANQAGLIMHAGFECFDDSGGWEKIQFCQWIAVKGAEWTQYQYRYAIPSRLVEYLVEVQDSPTVTPRHLALAAMIKTVFTAPTPLINLSTSDIISSLITLILRRVMIDAEDPLLPLLVECIASLGSHVYYADQIQDLSGELVSRLVIIETSGLGFGKGTDKGRVKAVRCLLAGLVGLLHAADQHEALREDIQDESRPRKSGNSATASSSPPPIPDIHIKPSRRTRLGPEIWQDTLTLLCDSDYSVRADFVDSTVLYLKNEIPKLGDYTDGEGVRRTRPLSDGPARQVSTMSSVMYGDATTRFLHALHAHIYVLATSSVLDPLSSSLPTPQRSENGHAISEGSNSRSRESPPESRRSNVAPPRSRKTSVTLRILRNAPRNLSTAPAASAYLSDYINIHNILIAVHENLPIRGLLTGIPMLLALDNACQCDTTTDSLVLQRIRVIREIVLRVWLMIGKIWNCPDVVTIAEKALTTSFVNSSQSSKEQQQPGMLCPPKSPVPLDASTDDSAPIAIDSEALLMAIVSSQNVHEITGLDRQALLRRFGAQWTPESAFTESVEIPTSYDAIRGGDTISPLVNIAPALMQVENNMSLQSLARSTRGVGVTDLREALEGRSSMSNPNLPTKAPSLSTLEHASSLSPNGELAFTKLAPVRSRPQQRSKLGRPGDVKDVLNKLGIGMQNGNNMLKSSFPVLQKSESRSER